MEENYIDEGAQESRGEGRPKRSRYDWFRWLSYILTGELLISKGAKRSYSVLYVLSAIFFVAIFMMFASIHREISYVSLTKEVSLLRERAIRSIERRGHESSHSEILRRVERERLGLQDPHTQPQVLE